MARLIAVVLVLYALLLIAAWVWQRNLIFLPLGGVPSPGSAGLHGAEPVRFATDDGLTLNGWFVPAREPATRSTVIVFNGNAGNRAYRAPFARALAERGFATMLFDYRGYGENRGTPSEEGLALDARAAQGYVASRTDVDATQIVYFGESLGTAVAVRLAIERQPRALILRSPFTSLADVGRDHYPFLPVRWLLRDPFDVASRMKSLHCPVLVIAGDADRIISIVSSERVYREARDPKQFVKIAGADHNDAELQTGRQLLDAVVSFLK